MSGWGQRVFTGVRHLQVLVVDDDSAICELIADILGDVGVATLCAANDREAYAALDREETVTAVVVDLNLREGTTGFDVARAARAKLPALDVLYISGESSDASFRRFGVEGSRCLFKPFTASELLAALGLAERGTPGSASRSSASAF